MTGKRILVTGGKGLLGSEIFERFSKDCRLVLTDREECDVTDIDSVRRFAREVRPEIVLHCAAYTAVDRAEGDREAAFALNEGGTRNVARVSREAGALLVTYGTDYVFDGTSGSPYAEEEPRPMPGTWRRRRGLSSRGERAGSITSPTRGRPVFSSMPGSSSRKRDIGAFPSCR